MKLLFWLSFQGQNVSADVLSTVSKSPLRLLFDNQSRLRAFRCFLQLSNHVAASPVSQHPMQNANTRDVYDVFLVSISWMKLEVKNLLPRVSGEQNRKIILGKFKVSKGTINIVELLFLFR